MSASSNACSSCPRRSPPSVTAAVVVVFESLLGLTDGHPYGGGEES